MSTSPKTFSVRRLSVPFATAMVAGLCVVSASFAASAAGGHHRVSVIHAGSAAHVVPTRKEY